MYHKYLFINQKELTDFFLYATKNNAIRIFWKRIISDAPKSLKIEIKTRPTRLVRQPEGKFVAKVEAIYQFQALDASKELRSYLETYAVFVENK